MLQGKRILLVDGNDPLFGRFVEPLGRAGALPVHVKTAEDALDLLQRENFDLLVFDLHLPVMGAYQFCRELERSPRLAEMPVVPVCDNPFIGSINISVCPNVADLLPKPFTTDDLIDVINRVLSGRSALARLRTRRPAERQDEKENTEKLG